MKEFCDTDKVAAKKIVESLQSIHCEGADKDQNKLSLSGKVIKLSLDTTNDYRSERPGPATSDFVNAEMKKLLKISVANSRDKDNADRESRKQKQAKEEQDRDEKRAREEKKREEEQKKIQDDVAAQVKKANDKAQKKAEKYQT